MEAKVGLGDGGKTLKEILEEGERLYQDTGFFNGLEELPLLKADPMKLELLQSRIISALVAARETTRMIAANPMVRELSELAVALYTPAGDCVAQSTGIIIHIPLMGETIKWMIRQNYEEEVGISDGDIFTSNDDHIAGMHPPDVYDIMPFFWEEELIGWIGTVIMERECGGLAPGLGAPACTESFVDGYRISCLKTGRNDKINRDWEKGLSHMIRMAAPFILDRKGALAANTKAREEIKRAITEFGPDYFKMACREMIESERRSQLDRIRMRMVPGRLRTYHLAEATVSKVSVPLMHRKDHYTLIPIEIRVEHSGKTVFDFDGAGPWGWHQFNCTPQVIEGAVSLTVTQSTAYSGKANTGTMLTVDIKAPYDTIVNPSTPYVSSNSFFHFAFHLGNSYLSLISRLFFCRGFKEEIMVGGGGFGEFQVGGTDHYGHMFCCPVGEGLSLGGGAFAYRDGIDIGHSIWIPENDAGNVEVWELMLPLVQLSRKLEPTSAAYGKYRSGYSWSSSYLVYKSPCVLASGPSNSNYVKIYPNMGLFGGYTGPVASVEVLENPNIKELVSQKKHLVHEVGDPRAHDITKLPGKHSFDLGMIWEVVVKDGDLIQRYMSSCAGGYGDPIERELALVRKDLDNNLGFIEGIKNIYCVEVLQDEKSKEWNIDEQKTKDLRNNKRNERLKRGIPVREWWKKRRGTIINKELPTLLKEAYNGSLAKGDRWPKEFRAFWKLPDNFTF